MKKPSAPCAMLLDWLPSVTLKELARPARKSETESKLNRPVPRRKLLFRNCRNSPPPLSELRPHKQLNVLPATNVVSPRPDGNGDGPPKLSAPPAMLICGS